MGVVTLTQGLQPKGTEDKQPFDVFLCHNSADKAEVRALAAELRRRGVKPWLDEEQVLPGRSIRKTLEAEIGFIKAAAVCVGTSGIGPWQDVEIDALLDEFIHRGCPVMPVLLPGCPAEPPLPIFLQRVLWVDWRDSEPAAIERLVAGVRGGGASPVADETHGRRWVWFGVAAAAGLAALVIAVAVAAVATRDRHHLADKVAADAVEASTSDVHLEAEPPPARVTTGPFAVHVTCQGGSEARIAVDGQWTDARGEGVFTLAAGKHRFLCDGRRSFGSDTFMVSMDSKFVVSDMSTMCPDCLSPDDLMLLRAHQKAVSPR